MTSFIVIVRVLDDAFTDFESEIQSAERRITKFEVFDNAERVQIVIEGKSVLTHSRVERIFSRVSEWRMAEIVYLCERCPQIDVQSKLIGDGAQDLRHLDGVSQT